MNGVSDKGFGEVLKLIKKMLSKDDKLPTTTVGTKFRPVLRTHAASRKGLLDGAVDPPSFSTGVVGPVHSSQDVLVNWTLQLTRRESLSVIKGGTCRCYQTVPNVRL